VLDKNGKRCLDIADEGHTYEIEKPRSKPMKREVLNPLSLEIISTIIEVNRELRVELESVTIHGFS